MAAITTEKNDAGERSSSSRYSSKRHAVANCANACVLTLVALDPNRLLAFAAVLAMIVFVLLIIRKVKRP